MSNNAILGQILTNATRLQNAFNEDFNDDLPIISLVGHVNQHLNQLKALYQELRNPEMKRTLEKHLRDNLWTINLVGERIIADPNVPEEEYSETVNEVLNEIIEYVRDPRVPI